MGIACVLPLQLATPPGSHVYHVPKGNLVIVYEYASSVPMPTRKLEQSVAGIIVKSIPSGLSCSAPSSAHVRIDSLAGKKEHMP